LDFALLSQIKLPLFPASAALATITIPIVVVVAATAAASAAAAAAAAAPVAPAAAAPPGHATIVQGGLLLRLILPVVLSLPLPLPMSHYRPHTASAHPSGSGMSFARMTAHGLIMQLHRGLSSILPHYGVFTTASGGS
jgi:hypothetical protein